MAVTFTTNIGLAKFTESELAYKFARVDEVAKANNTIIEDETFLGVNPYTPVLGAQTTPPNVGAGTLKGEYQYIQGIVFGSFVIDFVAPGISIGSGEYGISLPFVVDSSFHVVGTAFNATPGSFHIIGDGYIYDSGGSATCLASLDAVTVGGVSYARFLTEAHTAPAKTSRMARDSMPVVVGDLDKFVGTFTYKSV